MSNFIEQHRQADGDPTMWSIKTAVRKDANGALILGERGRGDYVANIQSRLG